MCGGGLSDIEVFESYEREREHVEEPLKVIQLRQKLFPFTISFFYLKKIKMCFELLAFPF